MASGNHELDDAKEEVQREHEQKIKERKRQIEKTIRDTLREQRERFEEQQEQAKQELKKSLAEKFERKYQKLESEQKAIKEDCANRQKVMEQVGEKAFNELKEKIEMDMKQDWEAEKRKFERDLQEKHEGQNAINLQIEESKTQVNKLERKIKEVEGQHRLVETALEDCLADKKIKLKELSEQRLMNHSNAQH